MLTEQSSTWQHSRCDTQLGDMEFTLSAPVTGKVASMKHAKKYGCRVSMKKCAALCTSAPKASFPKSETQKQVQGKPPQAPPSTESQCTTVIAVKKPKAPTNTYELTAMEILPERRCHSVDLDLNLADVESSQKKRKAKLLGSLERGLDKVITVLTAGTKK